MCRLVTHGKVPINKNKKSLTLTANTFASLYNLKKYENVEKGNCIVERHVKALVQSSIYG
jgi:hypothetical protein